MLSDGELVVEFRSIAQRLGDDVVNWESGMAATERLRAVTAILRGRGRGARLRLTPLLDDENRFVRYYAARHLLALLPERSRKIIEENAKQHDTIAGDAGMLLHRIDSGQYKPD
jgi:hypothetical protein